MHATDSFIQLVLSLPDADYMRVKKLRIDGLSILKISRIYRMLT